MESAANLFRIPVSVSLVRILVNKLIRSTLTIWFEWMGALLIRSSKWAKFMTYDEDLPISRVSISPRKRPNGWHAEPLLLTMGLNGIPSLWTLGCVVACRSVVWAVCISFMIWDFCSYKGSMTAFFPSSGLAPFNFMIANIVNLPEYSTLSITTVALPLSAGRIMIFSSPCKDLMTSHLSLRGFDFSGVFFLFAHLLGL